MFIYKLWWWNSYNSRSISRGTTANNDYHGEDEDEEGGSGANSEAEEDDVDDEDMMGGAEGEEEDEKFKEDLSNIKLKNPNYFEHRLQKREP